MKRKLDKLPWFKQALRTGFGLASVAGPLCGEPIWNVHFWIESIKDNESVERTIHFEESVERPSDHLATSFMEVTEPKGEKMKKPQEPNTALVGSVMRAIREAVHQQFARRSAARIAEPVLSLEVLCEQSIIGKVYGVLTKKRATIVDEDVREGTSIFIIRALMPVVESFSLSGELRQQGSGDVHWHASFSGFSVIDEDCFGDLNLTQADLEDEGLQLAARKCISRDIIKGVRKRKGFLGEEVMVKDATKQRNLTRMK